MQLSYQQIRDLINAKLSAVQDWGFVKDVYSDFFTYEKEGSTLYKRTYSVTDDGDVVLGEAEKVLEEKTYHAAAFGLAQFSDSGEYVTRTGTVFEIGEYPDKQFTLTEAEADAALASFAPVDNNLEHQKTILDGSLGRLESVRREGNRLIGSVSVPKWLHLKAGDKPIKTSLEFDRTTKRIVGNGLVLHPRITHAAVFAAFNDLAQSQEPTAGIAENNGGTMKLSELKAWFTGQGITVEDDGGAPTPAAPAPSPTNDQSAQFAAENERLKAELAHRDEQLLDAEAAKFADEAVKERRVLPAMRDAIAAQFKLAAKADASGAALFSAGTLNEGTSLKALKDEVSNLPQHTFTAEQIKVVKGDRALLSGESGDKDPRIAEFDKGLGLKEAM